jgi:cell division septation protein DedD
VPAPPREAPAARETATSSAPPRDTVPPPAPTAAPESTASKPTPRPAPATPPAGADAAAAAKSVQATDRSGSGFAVQVAAFNDKRESADALAKQLIAKGYPAFVLDPAAGAPAIFRVRVGKYKTRQEAQAIMAKLQSEQFSSAWIAR